MPDGMVTNDVTSSVTRQHANDTQPNFATVRYTKPDWEKTRTQATGSGAVKERKSGVDQW